MLGRSSMLVLGTRTRHEMSEPPAMPELNAAQEAVVEDRVDGRAVVMAAFRVPFHARLHRLPI